VTTAPPTSIRAPQERDADAPGFLLAGDALRALAALAVVAFHAEQGVSYGLGEPYRSDPGAVSWIGPWLAQGSAGVWVFFALSGYLVGGPWVRAALGTAPRPAGGRYVARRLRRIVPAFWVVLAVVLVRFGTYDHDAGQILRLFAFAQNTGTATVDGVLPQGWTLGCELAFYAVLPVLAVVVAVLARGWRPGRGTRRALVLGAIVLVSAASLVVKSRTPNGDWSLTILATAWGFAPGLLLAAVEDVVRPRLAGRPVGRALAALLLAGAVAIFAGLALSGPHVPPLRVEYLHGGIGACLIAAGLVWQWSAGTVPHPLRSRVAHALGTWSYGIYLVHVAAGREVRRHLPSGLSIDVQLAISLGGMVAGSIIAAAVLWWLVEQPALTGRRPVLSWAGLTAPLRAPVARR
jgi:peptidoglycan/LPS O-acetylase OafA/YrhL